MWLKEQKAKFRKMSKTQCEELIGMGNALNAHTFYKACESYLRAVLVECMPLGTEIFLFGSRANHTAGRISDIDIGFRSPSEISPVLLSEIADIIEDSFVPFRVDLVDFSKVSKDFEQEALKKIVRWT
ncbi:nucleotidyltransferase family protein [Thermoflexibacter ruber]|uniref:Nucleotidyltransferase domain-containing protein n=1 Tax=Thermoflexibacter ruber TaxID=1003 RepID=A0A1I2GLY6_9BACT|nr:nucleotidyltransferase domain-containing protein [Thermoflexibacter ruber]SFF18258.1 Nucleotidyltransferase domain-containing protein [Thermoflexibacter ruber]